jgi:hypothetical protein
MSDVALYFTLLTLCSVGASLLTKSMKDEDTTFRQFTNVAQWFCLTGLSVYWAICMFWRG